MAKQIANMKGVSGVYLSRRQYCSAMQCPKMLWLQNNRPEAFDDTWQACTPFVKENEVSHQAKSLFGEYREVTTDDFQQMIETTKKLMDTGIPTICNGSFFCLGLSCSVDILRNCSEGCVEVYQVKSTKGRIHDIYLHDLSFQCYVLHKLGYQVRKASLIHIDHKHKMPELEKLDVTRFFSIDDMSRQVLSSYDSVANNIERIRRYMEHEEEPLDGIGLHCHEPYSCGFYSYCTRSFPKHEFFDFFDGIPGFRIALKFQLYHRGLISFDELQACNRLTEKQRWQVAHELDSGKDHIEEKFVRGFLDELSYPMYFLGFGSFYSILQIYEWKAVAGRIIFQYSAHYMEKCGGELKHKGFLAPIGCDPRRAVAEKLCEDIPPNACVVTYDKETEGGFIKNLAEMYPDLRDRLMCIYENAHDLMEIFFRCYYRTVGMHGSYFFNPVLKEMFPDDPSLGYQGIGELHNWREASRIFASIETMPEKERKECREHLLRGSEFYTFAMFRIWQGLNEAVK